MSLWPAGDFLTICERELGTDCDTAVGEWGQRKSPCDGNAMLASHGHLYSTINALYVALNRSGAADWLASISGTWKM